MTRMGLSFGKGSVVGQHVEGTRRWVACSRCGEYNESGAPRCRDCMTSFLEMPVRTPVRTAVRTRVSKPTNVNAGPNLDALWSELEELTHSDELVRFQCPVCSSLVDGAATRCACGAIFEDPREPVGYACPLCNLRVASDSVRCRCGARFSD